MFEKLFYNDNTYKSIKWCNMNPVLILPAFYTNTSLGDFDRKNNSPFIIIRLALFSMCPSFFP